MYYQETAEMEAFDLIKRKRILTFNNFVSIERLWFEPRRHVFLQILLQRRRVA